MASHAKSDKELVLTYPITRLKFLCCTLFLTAFSGNMLFGQGQGSNWYFGNQAGITFTTNPPTAVTGSLNTSEGCSSISDAQGNLLFYTDGSTVYTRNHTVMANGTGLWGNFSSTQSAIIIKQPGNTNLYYIFTMSAVFSCSLAYSIVDMNLATGNGSVTIKNTLLATQLTEKVTGVLHANNTDVWVVTKEGGSSTNFKAYLLTSAGVSTTAVVSAIGSSGSAYALGQMKFSPDGSKLAAVQYFSGGFACELFDFNRTSGALSNSVGLNGPGMSTSGYYGVEFSPNGSLLYASRPGTICQWNACAGSATAIAASLYTISASNNWGMQLAPDGKIYVAKTGSVLSVINNPNLSGSACNFSLQGFAVSPNACTLGLPNYVTSWFMPPPSQFTTTIGTGTNGIACMTASFTAPNPASLSISGCSSLIYTVSAMHWNFGDPGSGSSNTTAVTNPLHSFSGLGTYTVSLIISYSGNIYNDTLTQVLQINQPCVTVNSTSITCANLGSATVQATGGLGPFNYTWMPTNQTSPVATGLSPGSYTITVFDIGNNYSYTAQTIFTPLVPLSGNLSTAASVQCNGAATASAAMTGLSGGSGTQNYLWTNGQTSFTTATVYSLSAGLWSVTVTDALTACQVNDVFLILQPPAMTVNISASTGSICLGGSVSFTGQATGGTAPYTYSWTSGPASSTMGVSEPTAGIHIYTLQSRDSYSCAATQTISADFVAPPIVTVASASICPLQTGTLIANGATNFTWSTSSNNPVITDSPTSTTVYTVTGEALLCTSTATGAIVVKPLPTPLWSSNSPVCAGSQLNLYANGGQSYLWNGPQSFNNNTQNPSISSATLNNSGVYSCTVTASNGCTASVSGTVTVNPIPTVSASASTVCVNGNLQLTSGSSASVFAWNGPSGFTSGLQNPSLGNLSVNNSGTYTVTVTGTGGCTNIATAHGSVVAMPVVSFTTNSPRCAGETLSLNYTGSSVFSYQWSGPNGFQSNIAAPFIANSSAAASGVYSIAVTYGPCAAGASSPVTVFALPTPSASYNGPVCEGKAMGVQVTTAPGEIIISYAWNGPAGFAATTSSASIAPALPVNTGVYSATVTDIHTCKASTSVSVTVLSNPTVSASGPTVCLNAPATLSASGADSYFWTGPWLKTDNVANAVVSTANSSVPVQYFVTGTAVNGCTATASASVFTWPLPVPSLSVTPSATVCLDGIVTLSGNGGWVYTWTLPNNSTLTAQTITVGANSFDLSGTYTLSVTDRRGCSNTAVTSVSVIAPPALALLASSFEGCVPFCPQFSASASTPSLQAKWTIGNNAYTGKAFSHCFTQAGTFLVKSTYSDMITGCGSSSVFSVTARPAIEAAFEWSPEEPVEKLDDVTFVNTTRGDNNTWRWYFGNQIDSTHLTVSRTYDTEGKFPVVLVAKNEWGCADTLIKTVEILPDFHIYVPNAFTPNADGVNDVFIPVTRGVVRYSLEIFDRWGAMIFRTEDLSKGWDGTYHGEQCMKGAYTWKLSAAPVNKPAVMKTGSVVLYR